MFFYFAKVEKLVYRLCYVILFHLLFEIHLQCAEHLDGNITWESDFPGNMQSGRSEVKEGSETAGKEREGRSSREKRESVKNKRGQEWGGRRSADWPADLPISELTSFTAGWQTHTHSQQVFFYELWHIKSEKLNGNSYFWLNVLNTATNLSHSVINDPITNQRIIKLKKKT